jgi:hypothetical protein
MNLNVTFPVLILPVAEAKMHFPTCRPFVDGDPVAGSTSMEISQ